MLFLKTKIIDINTVKDLIYEGDRVRTKAASVTGKTTYNPTIRATTLKLVDPKLFPDISYAIEKALPAFDLNIVTSDYEANEFNYLHYKQGDHFKRHQDVIKADRPRVFTTVTLVDKSDDLVGGDLLLWDKQGNEYRVDLQIGETVIFRSNTMHQVTPVEQGTRETLVVWVTKRLD